MKVMLCLLHLMNQAGGLRTQLMASDSLIRADPLLFLGVCPRFVHLLLFLVLLIIYTPCVWQGGRGGGWSAGRMGRPHPADDPRLCGAVLGRGLGEDGFQRIDSILCAALCRSRVALPQYRALLRVSLFLVLSVQVVIEGNDVGDFLFPPALFPQPGV